MELQKENERLKKANEVLTQGLLLAVSTDCMCMGDFVALVDDLQGCLEVAEEILASSDT